MSNSHSKVNESIKLRWNSFPVAYLGFGFTVLMISALFYGSEQGKLAFAGMVATGVFLMALGFIADEISHRRGDYNYKTPGQIQ